MANTELGKAYVQIIPSAQGVGGGIADAIQPGAKSAGKAAGTTVSKSMGQQISAVGKKFMKVGGIATALSVPVISGIKDAMSAYETQYTAETKLTEIYKTRMGAGDKAVESTKRLASALQQEGIIGDEVALSGAQQLATFAKYPSTINTLLPAMNNLLAQQKGVNATTDDAVSIGNLMGKVMQGQTGALKRVGISFTEAQEKVLKYGTEEERAAMLSEVITSNVGNMNSELAKTPAGQMAQLSNTLGDIKEELGAALAPVLAQVAGYVSKNVVPLVERLVGFIQGHPIIAKIAVAIAGLLAVGGPLLIMLGSIMTIAPMVAAGFSALLGPIGLVVAGIGAAIAVGVALYKNWDKIKKAAGILKDAIAEKFKQVKDAIIQPIKAAKDAVKGIIDKIKKFFDFKVSLPNIKLPHFVINPPGWSLGDLLHGVIPDLDIDWYAKGAIMTRPTVFGGGEAGNEGIIPLDPFWARLDAMADSIVNGVATVAAAGAGGYGDIKLDVYMYPNGPKMMEETVRMYDKGKKILG